MAAVLLSCIQDSAGIPACVCAAGYSGNGSYCSGWPGGHPGLHSGMHGVAVPIFSLTFPLFPPACFSQLLSLEVDPCASGHGGCSPYANCTKVAPGQRTCTCQDGYTGDGELCQGEVSPHPRGQTCVRGGYFNDLSQAKMD